MKNRHGYVARIMISGYLILCLSGCGAGGNTPSSSASERTVRASAPGNTSSHPSASAAQPEKSSAKNPENDTTSAALSSGTSDDGPQIIDFATLYGYGDDRIDVPEEEPQEQKAEEAKTPEKDSPPEQTAELSMADETANYDAILAPANDDLDYLWANDYYYNAIAKQIRVHDAKAYREVFGFSNPTINDLKKILDDNRDIPEKYKTFIISYLDKWLELYPGSDFTLFAQNLSTLKINEIPPDQMKWAALSASAAACYRPAENTIYVKNTIDITATDTSDYIVLTHELTHPATGIRTNLNGNTVHGKFYDYDQPGEYADECLITYYVYKMQGLGHKSEFYVLASNYYRIILDCLGDTYTGADYMNHQVNYLAEKMDEYMGDKNYALRIIDLIDLQMDLHYGKYVDPERKQEDFQELYDYITRMYMKKYLKPGMDAKQAESVLDNLVNEMTTNFQTLSDVYAEITEDKFRPAFEACCKESGIALN